MRRLGPAWTCAAVTGAAALLGVVAAQGGRFSASALVQMADTDHIAPYAAAADHKFHFVTAAQHYDGVYYYAIARDPFATGTAHTLIDQAPYRYGHPLFGWLAGLLSLGRPAAVPTALLMLTLLSAVLAAWATSRLVSALGGSPWAGLAVALSPGLLYAVSVSTTETVSAALVVGAVLAWHEQRWRLAGVLLVLCCFDKEPLVLVPLALAAWEIVPARRTGVRPSAPALKAVALAAGPVLLAGWFGYVHARLNAWPFSSQSGNLGRPARGWHETLTYAKALSGGSFDQYEATAVSPPLLVATATLLLIAGAVALRLRSLVAPVLLGVIALTACQDWRTLLYPHDMIRTTSLATLLAVIVLATRARRSGTGDELDDVPGELASGVLLEEVSGILDDRVHTTARAGKDGLEDRPHRASDRVAVAERDERG
jgi:hypothetical protein